MARLGAFEFPEVELSEVTDIARRIDRQFGGEISRTNLARLLEMSERGGRFSVVVGGLRTWGVAEGRGALRLTRLGSRLVAPMDVEEAMSVRSMIVKRVQLFTEIHRRIGDVRPDTTALTLLLEEITGADRGEIDGRLAAFERVLREVYPYLGAAPVRASSPQSQSGTDHAPPVGGESPEIHDSEIRAAYRSDTEDSAPASGRLSRRSPAGRAVDGRIRLSYSAGTVDLAENAATLDAAIALLQARRRELLSELPMPSE